MKIAIISDIHGNLEALNKVLEDIKSRNIDEIYCLGDIIAKGTHQQECVDLVRKYCKVVVMGNCDDAFTRNYDESELAEASAQEVKRYEWNKTKISEESKEYIRSLPFCHEFYLSGRLVRLMHAHPVRNDIFIGNIDYLHKLYELFLPSENTVSNEKADILIYGHIHTPFVQKIYNRYIVNPGSVGNAIDVFRNDEKDADCLNTTVANYLILTGNMDSGDIKDPISYELVSLSYDIDKEIAANTDNIELESYSNELKLGKYRDMDRIYKSFEARGIKKEEI